MKILSLLKSLLFTILAPGMYQVIYGEEKRGALLFILSILLGIGFYTFGIWRSFGLLVLFLLLVAILVFYAFLNAVKIARSRIKFNRSVKHMIVALLMPVILWSSEFVAGRFSSVYEAFVPTTSMVPTVMHNDYLIIDQNFYKENAIVKGEVIMFYNDYTDNYFLKRVAGLPGDTIRFVAGRIFVNDTDYIKSLPFEFSDVVEFQDTTFTVPAGYAFVLGDNLNDSFDSRYFGPVKIEYISGKPLYVYWSDNFSRIGKKI